MKAMAAMLMVVSMNNPPAGKSGDVSVGREPSLVNRMTEPTGCADKLTVNEPSKMVSGLGVATIGPGIFL